MKRFLVLVLAAIIAVPLHSRKYPDVPRAYAYGNSLDLQGGLVGMPFSVSGDAGRAFGIGAGGEFNIRYSHFFWKHWGIFASFSYLGTTVDAPCWYCFKKCVRTQGPSTSKILQIYQYFCQGWLARLDLFQSGKSVLSQSILGSCLP